MTRKELVKAVSDKVGASQKDVKAILEATREVAYEAAAKDEVCLFDGLTLYSKVNPARNGRNPMTGEALVIPEKRVPRAKFGTKFKKAVAE